MSLQYLERAKSWLSDSFDNETIEAVGKLISENSKELEESFYKNLEFGTGGLRGVMGVGTNRVNKYTIGMATQGFANYLRESFDGVDVLSVAIAFDNRNNSSYFASIAADVFSANGIKVYLFESLRPTPELSFAIRHLKCSGGVMLTASHNPKEYNGYKVYWEDGAQVTSPHDKNIIDHVNKISDPSVVKFKRVESNVEVVGKDIDKAYLEAILSLTLNKEVKRSGSDLKIVYTPLHGTGVEIVPEALRQAGFSKVFNVPEQDISDGNFPTVDSPNPEEPGALKMALEKAEEVGADLVMATDPDSDRLGIAIRDNQGKLLLLNGNQMASILTYYLLENISSANQLKKGKGGDYMVKTIVTTDLMKSICDFYDIEIFNVLTGFKYIAEVVRSMEGKRRFIGGGEESYGFNVGEFVRDKDAVVTCCLVAEAAVWSRERGMKLYDLLIEIYNKFGFYLEHLISMTKRGIDGKEQIDTIMKNLRNSPPESIDGSQVVLVHDYLKRETIDIVSDLRYKIGLPQSNVLQFVTSDNTIVSVRPSGTEPKIKFYIGVKGDLDSMDEFARVKEQLMSKIKRIERGFTDL